MDIIQQSHEIIFFHPEEEIYKICSGYCQCYKTPIPETHEGRCDLIRRHRGHGSPLEHGNMTVIFVTNRGVTHELVRHRHTAYSQESTRYCNYSKDKFGNSIKFIEDSNVINSHSEEIYNKWVLSLKNCEDEYMSRIKLGQKPEEARGCLINDVATTIQVTANLREWRDIFSLRCSRSAHYQIRELMLPLLRDMQRILPCIFEDIFPVNYY